LQPTPITYLANNVPEMLSDQNYSRLVDIDIN